MLDVLESYWLTYTAAWDDDNYSRHKITPVLELHGCSQATVHKAFPGVAVICVAVICVSRDIGSPNQKPLGILVPPEH